MKLYTAKIDTEAGRKIVADDMILTKALPTAAGSKMLAGYMSLFDAEVLDRLAKQGFTLAGKASVGEFSFDLLGETAHEGALVKEGRLVHAAAEILLQDDVTAAVCLDVNGSVRRAAAQSGIVGIKPTYGTVSRFGTIPVACSGETVSILAKKVADAKDVLAAMVGHDDKDGTSLPEEKCALTLKTGAQSRRVLMISDFSLQASDEIKGKLDAFASLVTQNGIEVVTAENKTIAAARAAWNILMCAELCNNVSRYDGVKYGYRTQTFQNIDELYTRSRTEAFGSLLKTAILFGSDTLSTENYQKVYDKALRVRRVIKKAFDDIFATFDAVLLPACSQMAYTEEQIKAQPFMAFEENLYTAPASITGLPTVTVGGVQLIGKAFDEGKLLALAELYEKEGK